MSNFTLGLVPILLIVMVFLVVIIVMLFAIVLRAIRAREYSGTYTEPSRGNTSGDSLVLLFWILLTAAAISIIYYAFSPILFMGS